MGLFDSRDGTSESGSTAEVAKILGAAVVLVVDAWALARSAAAMVLGFASFDPDLRLEGVVCNRVGGTAHTVWISEALASDARLAGVHFLGGLGKNTAMAIPERHLGLRVPGERQQHFHGVYQKIAAAVEASLDLDRLLELAKRPGTSSSITPRPAPDKAGSGERLVGERCRIGVFRDEAFCFYYHDNLRLLERAGATLVPVSPLRDQQLPEALDGLYIGGG